MKRDESTPDIKLRRIDDNNSVICTQTNIDITHVIPTLHAEFYVAAVKNHEPLLDLVKQYLFEKKRELRRALASTITDQGQLDLIFNIKTTIMEIEDKIAKAEGGI
jgi:predicted amidophosphoribosyltransferase